MKIAILSDIHANYEALSEVLTDVDAQNITTLLILGDLVGYYYEHKECFERLNSQKYQVFIIRGNHEEFFEQTLVDSKVAQFYIDKYGHSLELAKRELSDGEKCWLLAAPKFLNLELGGKKILLCHGAPWDVNEYVYPDSKDEIFSKFSGLEADYILMGHTHHKLNQEIDGVRLLNFGSVGQNRKVGGLASFGIIDLGNNNVVFKDVPYDVSRLVASVSKIDENLPYLKNVLLRKQ